MKLEELKHAFEALSTLSDAQDLLADGDVDGANERINHAKEHLCQITEANPRETVAAILAGTVGCSLAAPDNSEVSHG